MSLTLWEDDIENRDRPVTIPYNPDKDIICLVVDDDMIQDEIVNKMKDLLEDIEKRRAMIIPECVRILILRNE